MRLRVRSFQDLECYQEAFQLQQTVFEKRKYPAHFLNKLTDVDGELQETLHWLNTASACGYLSAADYDRLGEMSASIGRRLGSMISQHESFCHSTV
jgi:hypothetical protein